MDKAMILYDRITTPMGDWFTSLPIEIQHAIEVMAVGAVIVGLILGFTLHKGKKVPGEETMKKEAYIASKRQRKLREHTLIADGVGDLLLDLFAKGELTQERYKYWHLRFGTQLGLKDLLPVALTPQQIKDAMRKRIGNGVYKPVHIPGPPIQKKRYKNKLEEILATVK